MRPTPRETQGRPLDYLRLDRAARSFDLLVKIFDAQNEATAQDAILRIVCLVGFRSARLYYLNPTGRLAFEKSYGLQPKGTGVPGRLVLPSRQEHPASYQAI